MNIVLGGWYFNGSQLTDQGCTDNPPVIRMSKSSDVVGAINLYQCKTFTTAAEGIYSCIMMNSSMMEQTMRVGVYFSGRSKLYLMLKQMLDCFCYTAAPIIDPPLLSVVKAVVGSHITLSCTSQGSPPDTFTWKKGGGSIAQSTGITAVTYTSASAVFRAYYSISNYSVNDSGIYTCTVANPIGSDSNNITVITGTYMHMYINNCAVTKEN